MWLRSSRILGTFFLQFSIVIWRLLIVRVCVEFVGPVDAKLDDGRIAVIGAFVICTGEGTGDLYGLNGFVFPNRDLELSLASSMFQRVAEAPMDAVVIPAAFSSIRGMYDTVPRDSLLMAENYCWRRGSWYSFGTLWRQKDEPTFPLLRMNLWHSLHHPYWYLKA